MMDVWGQMYWDELESSSGPYFVDRDDGIKHEIESAAKYFTGPRSEEEAEFLDGLLGPVLDVGAGAGSYALYLQGRGLEVTAIDNSPKAVEVCRARGCRDARVMDLRALELEPNQFGSVIIMGNTLGAHQNPDTLPRFLAVLHKAVREGGNLLCMTMDPLETKEDVHLAYHERNRERGLPPGLTRIRIRYKELATEWMDFWMPTTEELQSAISGTGWDLVRERSVGPFRLRLFQNDGSVT
jgi:SAM-dependent methyltransferase